MAPFLCSPGTIGSVDSHSSVGMSSCVAESLASSFLNPQAFQNVSRIGVARVQMALHLCNYNILMVLPWRWSVHYPGLHYAQEKLELPVLGEVIRRYHAGFAFIYIP